MAESTIEPDEEETGEAPEAAEPEISETDEAPAEEEPVTRDQEPEPSPEPIPVPPGILEAARAVMGTFTEARPEGFVAKLEASGSEWMTITDDSLSNELERELLTSAAAMCLWQELMIWYLGEMPAPSLMPLARSGRYLSADKRVSGALCQSSDRYCDA